MWSRLGRLRLVLPVTAALLGALAILRSSAPRKLPVDIVPRLERLVWLNNWIDAAALAKEVTPDPREPATALLLRMIDIRGNLEKKPLLAARAGIVELLNTETARQSTSLRIQLLAARGDVEFQMDLAGAEEAWKAALDLAEKAGHTQWQNRARGELGTILFLKGEMTRALGLVSRAVVAAEVSGDVAAQIRYRTALGEGFAEFGRANDAIRLFDKALDLARATPGAYFPFTAHLGKARILALGEQRNRGVRMLGDALAEASAQGFRIREARILAVLGEVAHREGRRAEAAERFVEASAIANETGLRRLQAGIMSKLAAILEEQGKSELSEASAGKSVAAAERAGNRYHLPQLLAVLADTQMRAGRAGDAEVNYARAESLVDDFLRESAEIPNKNTLVAAMGRVFDGHFRLALLHQRDFEKAFRIVETARTRSSAHYAQLARETHFSSRNLVNLHLALGEERNVQRRTALLDRLWETEFRSFRLPAIGPYRKPVVSDSPASVAEIQETLDDDEILIEYVLSAGSSTVLAITRNQTGYFCLAGRDEIESSVREHARVLASKSSPDGSARKLFRLLLAPITLAEGKRRLVIVPDGQLHTAPFDAFVDHDGRFVLETRVVSYAPSATSLRRQSTQPEHGGHSATLLAVGGALYSGVASSIPALRGHVLFDPRRPSLWSMIPQSEKEVAEIGALAGIGSVVLTGERASEAAVKALPLDRFQVLHFASHGAADAEFPARSSLVLLADRQRGEDGLLQAREILALDLKAKLVTLSACDAGAGQLEGITGMNGLAQAFLMAGAQSVVASVWPAEDAFTANLMRAFYENLRAGHDKAEALTFAKRQMIATYGQNASPRLWGGFRLMGDARGKVWRGDSDE